MDGFVPEATVVVVIAWFTFCARADEALGVKLLSPGYEAVIEWGPRASVEVVKVACRDEFSVPVPMIVLPSLNVTVPVGVPPPGGTVATVAVNVTDCPKLDGLEDELTDVIELDWFTICVTALDVLLPNVFATPE
jgi:hypothetical protein